jgi:hypothetical protein
MWQTLVTDFEFWTRRRALMPPCGSPLMRTTNSVPLPVSELSGSSEMTSEDRGATIPCDMIERICQEAGAENCGEVGAIAEEVESRSTGPKIPTLKGLIAAK